LKCALCGEPLDAERVISVDGVDLHPDCYDVERYTDPTGAAGESRAVESFAGVSGAAMDAIAARGLMVVGYL
jgi:hypothetical protein